MQWKMIYDTFYRINMKYISDQSDNRFLHRLQFIYQKSNKTNKCAKSFKVCQNRICVSLVTKMNITRGKNNNLDHIYKILFLIVIIKSQPLHANPF